MFGFEQHSYIKSNAQGLATFVASCIRHHHKALGTVRVSINGAAERSQQLRFLNEDGLETISIKLCATADVPGIEGQMQQTTFTACYRPLNNEKFASIVFHCLGVYMYLLRRYT